MKLVWKLLRQHISVPQFAGFFFANLVGMLIVLLGDTHDVVSEEVVKEMVQGACKLFGTDYAIASSGCAGPTGGTEQIPVGTIWIACGSRDSILTKRLSGDLGRIPNVERATQEALKLMLQFLLNESVRIDPAKDYHLA